MSAFQVGDLVRAQLGVQGMVQGRVYRVVGRHDRATFVGTISTYDLEGEADPHERARVGNAHLLLSRVTLE